MTPDELISHVKMLHDSDIELMKAKNHDYANEDALSNIRDFGLLGIVVRLGDKYHRLKSFVEKGVLKVSDETVRDTLRDMRNYSCLADAFLDEGE